MVESTLLVTNYNLVEVVLNSSGEDLEGSLGMYYLSCAATINGQVAKRRRAAVLEASCEHVERSGNLRLISSN